MCLVVSQGADSNLSSNAIFINNILNNLDTPDLHPFTLKINTETPL